MKGEGLTVHSIVIYGEDLRTKIVAGSNNRSSG